MHKVYIKCIYKMYKISSYITYIFAYALYTIEQNRTRLTEDWSEWVS